MALTPQPTRLVWTVLLTIAVANGDQGVSQLQPVQQGGTDAATPAAVLPEVTGPAAARADEGDELVFLRQQNQQLKVRGVGRRGYRFLIGVRVGLDTHAPLTQLASSTPGGEREIPAELGSQ